MKPSLPYYMMIWFFIIILYGFHDIFYKYFHDKKYTTSHDSQRLKSSSNVNQEILFFNRIPKTGSEMMDLVLKWLREQNGFAHQRLKNPKRRYLTVQEQIDMVEEIYNIWETTEEPYLVVDRHVHFTNFTSLSRRMPIYFNMVRDPVEKLISRFYYARVTPRPGGFTPPGYITPEPANFLSLDECVAAGDPECTFVEGNKYDLTIPYFCGHDDICRELGNSEALQKAKLNVESWFPVVGVLEELNSTLLVCEDILPRYFMGAYERYYEGLQGVHYNKNRQKPMISEELKQLLKGKLKLEYEFYDFIKSRLLNQYHKQYKRNHHITS